MIFSKATTTTKKIEVIKIPFAKLTFFLRMPKKKRGRLIKAPILISPPNFFDHIEKL